MLFPVRQQVIICIIDDLTQLHPRKQTSQTFESKWNVGSPKNALQIVYRMPPLWPDLNVFSTSTAFYILKISDETGGGGGGGGFAVPHEVINAATVIRYIYE